MDNETQHVIYQFPCFMPIMESNCYP
jgi:hypothetical protein